MARRSDRSNRQRNRSTHGLLYTRRVLCTLCGVTEHELALWELEELIVPSQVLSRRGSREALYDEAAVRRARIIRTLGEELEVNVPGISIILRLLDTIGVDRLR